MLNKKTQYAFQALMYLAEHKDDGPVLIADIATKKKIPLKLLHNIFPELTKSGRLERKAFISMSAARTAMKKTVACTTQWYWCVTQH